MQRFRDRKAAGELLAKKLTHYQGQKVVVLALPRGGVEVAEPISKALDAPLDLILAHKIGHPSQPEFAIGALSEGGQLLITKEYASLIKREAKEKEMAELKRKRVLYLQGRESPSVAGAIAILVDDGVATGLTMKVGILELKSRRPAKIVVALPVAPQETLKELQKMADEVVVLQAPDLFLGSVGAYYEHFDQVEDEEVMRYLHVHF